MRTLSRILHSLKKVGRRLGAPVFKNRIIAIALPLAILAGVALFITLQLWPSSATGPNTTPAQAETPKERRAIDGVWVEKGMANPPLVSVMIENARDAQPIAGVGAASLAYESLVESTITRLMAVIPLPANQEGTDAPIGPVRSVRPYYLTWTTELGALLAHVGGSPDALDRIRVQGLLTLNEYANGKYFHRSRDRYAPHNTYTTTNALREAAATKLAGTALERWSQSLPTWQFKDDAPENARGTVATVTIGYAEPYTVTWQYNKPSNDYTRMQWGGTHTLSDGTPITTKNIAVVVARMAILDEIGRKQFTTEGSGKAYLFRDGLALVGTWQKDSPSARMRFFDADGNEMQFNGGTTWIEVVPITAPITY